MSEFSEVEFSEEQDLARRQPASYSKYVDGDPWNYVDEQGVRHVIVKDYAVEARYELKDGKIVLKELAVF